MMRVSNSEIEILAYKAATGIGLPAGLAEDAGTATVWLANFGFCGGAIACRAFDNLDTGRAGPLTVGNNESFLYPSLSGKMSSVFYAAPSVGDFLQTVSQVTVERLDEPLLLLGYLASLSWMLEASFSLRAVGPRGLSWQGWVYKDHGKIEGECFEDACEETGTQVTVESPARILDDGNAKRAQHVIRKRQITTRECLEITLGTFKTLQSLAAQTLVPETEVSRHKGAGAGLIDTD